MKYIISYERNDVYQCIGINAQTTEQAAAYFSQYKPSARILGISERMEDKPGRPVITVPDDFWGKPGTASAILRSATSTT